MKLGIVGAGTIVEEFLPQLVTLEGIEVLGILVRPSSKERAELLCAQCGVPHTVTSLEELCALGIDTAYIAVPNHLHFDYCKQALKSGLNVIVEKPMTSNAREAKEQKELAEENSLFLFEAITTVYFDSYRKIKEWLEHIGAIKLVSCNYSQYSRRYDAFKAGDVLPAFDPQKSGGALMDINLYNLHFVMGLFGVPNEVKYYANVEKGIDTSGILIMRYDGFVANCTAAKDCSAPFSFVIEGTEGYITINRPPNVIGEATLTLNDKTMESYPEPMASNRVIPEFKRFICAINEKDKAFFSKSIAASIAVSEVQTKARMEAGILFPADKL